MKSVYIVSECEFMYRTVELHRATPRPRVRAPHASATHAGQRGARESHDGGLEQAARLRAQGLQEGHAAVARGPAGTGPEEVGLLVLVN